jgi:hypothetical protein
MVQAVVLPTEPVTVKENGQITFLFLFNMVQGSRELEKASRHQTRIKK